VTSQAFIGAPFQARGARGSRFHQPSYSVHYDRTPPCVLSNLPSHRFLLRILDPTPIRPDLPVRGHRGAPCHRRAVPVALVNNRIRVVAHRHGLRAAGRAADRPWSPSLTRATRRAFHHGMCGRVAKPQRSQWMRTPRGAVQCFALAMAVMATAAGRREQRRPDRRL